MWGWRSGSGGSPVVHTYTYDAVGNRTSWNANTYTYDDANQLTSGAGITFDYDANGNQTERDADTFEWDHENRLTAAEIASTTWSHEYNGDGLRMSRGDGTTTVDYVWDVAAGLPLLLQDGTHTYVYGLGLIAIYDGSEMTYRLVDGLGSTVNLCDEGGELVGEYTYDAYGNVRSQDGAETEFSFAGEQSDPNGLDYLRARYYDPEIGRFLSGDPLGGGYGYAGGNPTNFVDPSGMVTVCTHWRDGLCAGTTVLPDQYAGLYYVAVDAGTTRTVYSGASGEYFQTVDLSTPKKGTSTPKAVNVGAQTTTQSDTIVKAEVAGATQQPTGDPGYEFQPALASCGGCGQQEAAYLTGSTAGSLEQESAECHPFGCDFNFLTAGPSPGDVLDAVLDAYGSDCGYAVASWLTGVAAVESIHAVYTEYTPSGPVLVIEVADEAGGYHDLGDNCF